MGQPINVADIPLFKYFEPKVPSFIFARISFNPKPPSSAAASMDLASAIARTTSLGVILTLDGDRGDPSRSCFSIDLAREPMEPDLVKR